MKKTVLALLIQMLVIMGFSQNKPAYVLYDANGKKVSYEKMLKTISKADMLLFGELHNNAVAHYLQVKIGKDLAKNKSKELITTANASKEQLFLKFI